MQYKQKLWLFIVRKSQAFETIRKRILSRFLLFNEKSTGLHTYLLSYQRKSDGEGTQTFLKLERQYFQDFFNGWSTEHDSIIISKKVWQKKSAQTLFKPDNFLPSRFLPSNQTYHHAKKILKKKIFDPFLKLFKRTTFSRISSLTDTHSLLSNREIYCQIDKQQMLIEFNKNKYPSREL